MTVTCTVDGFTALKALTDGLQVCAWRRRRPGPTAGSCGHHYRTQEAELDRNRLDVSPLVSPLQPPKAPSHSLLYRLLPEFLELVNLAWTINRRNSSAAAEFWAVCVCVRERERERERERLEVDMLS